MGKTEAESALVNIRKDKQLTQKAIATALGVTEQTVRNWEQGKCTPKLSIPQTKALCLLLELPIEQLPDSFASSVKRDASASE